MKIAPIYVHIASIVPNIAMGAIDIIVTVIFHK